jgi:uncharacterized phage protein gp47/JayE
MPFDLPTFDEMRDLLMAALSGRFPEANTNKRGGHYKLQSVIALGNTDLHSHIREVGLDVMPDTAEGDELDRHAEIYGLSRKLASGSAKSAALRVFGDVGATVPNNEAMTHIASGLQFETRSTGVIAAIGYLDVDVAAISVGVQTNLEVDQELQFDVTPVNLEDNARIILELEGGQDQEEDDALRPRVLNRIREPAAGGNRNDYENFLLESDPLVDSGYVYPNRNGLGTVDLAALKGGTGTARLLDAGERAAVLAVIDPLRPVSATIRILEVTANAIDVEATILPVADPAYVWDWGDATPLVVSGYVAGTRTLTFTTARPAEMAVGDRLIVDNASATGVEFVIEALSSTDAVVLELDLGFAPGADNVYSGSPITQAIRQAVIDLFDALGPANPDDAGYNAPHEGNLRLSNLFEAIQTEEGVLDSTIIDPVANVVADDPAFPDNDTIELLIPGKILIRRQH